MDSNGPKYNLGALDQVMGNHGFFHCSKGSKLRLGQGQNGSSDTNNHKLNTNPQGSTRGTNESTVGIND